MKIVNPSNNQVIKEIQEDSKDTIHQKYNKASDAQKDWQHSKLEDRLKIIAQFSALLEKECESLAKDLSDEVGKPLQEA